MINISLKKKLENLKVIIAAHEFTIKGGAAQDLEKFLLANNVVCLLYISHPLLYMKAGRQLSSRYRYFEKGKLKQSKTTIRFRFPDALLYGKDLFLTLYWAIMHNGRYDLFAGYDPLNAIAGIILKKLGFVKHVIYYSIDYFPQRFENKIMNGIYHKIDKFCVRFSDETWNVGSRMSKARQVYNSMNEKLYSRQYRVPMGIWFSKIERKSFEKIDKKKLIYAGHLAPYMGVELVIKSMQKLVKEIPDIHLEIIGMGESEGKIKELAKKLGVFGAIAFYGWIDDRKTFEERLCDGAVGLAPFTIDMSDERVKNADPGKLKDYMACGLPVVTTKAVATYQAIERAGAGIIIDYDVNQLYYAVLKLLKNRDLLAQYRANALSYVKQFDWERLFEKNLERLLRKKQ